MNLALIGLSHKNAPIEARERLAVLPLPELYKKLRGLGCREAVALSTCNRFELYVCGEMAVDISQWARPLLEGVTGADLAPCAYVHAGARAVHHLFEVAAGLDSLVVGETEILGQVKNAYENARAAGMTGKQSNVLFQRALFIGKKVRSDTAIAVGQTSVASVAVQLAETIFGELSSCRVLILGAGAMAESTARHLMSRKVSELSIANRTFEKAQALAQSLRAKALAWENFAGALDGFDVVIASTGSERPILTRQTVAEAAGLRGGRSLFIIDIAMPRDVEESVHGLEHVYLYRLEDLESIVADNLKGRAEEVEKARRMASARAEEFCAWQKSLEDGREISLKHARPGAGTSEIL